MNAYIGGLDDTIFDPPFLADPGEDAQHPTILELGSGTGVVAAQIFERLSSRRCRIIATDLPEVCPLLEKNLSQYITGSYSLAPTLLVRPLAWGNQDHARAILKELASGSHDIEPSSHSGPASTILTHIICSDLVRTISLLYHIAFRRTAHNGNASLVIADIFP